MDIVKIAGRIASSRVFQFKGTVYTEFEGETNSGQGVLTFDGKDHEVEFSTGGRDMALTIDGKPVDPEQHTELYNEVENFLTLNFPDLDDERWVEDTMLGSKPEDLEEEEEEERLYMDLEVSGPGFP